MTDTERHGPVPRRPAARPDRRTSYFDENQASQAKKPSKNDMPSPHRRRSGGPAAGMVTFRHSFPPQSMRRPYQKNAAKTGQKFLSKLNPNANPKKFSLNTVYGHFKKASGGCDGGVEGHNGSMNPICLFLILQHLDVYGRRLVDLGAGEGRVLASALACGAEGVYGHELPANRAHKFVFDAVLVRMAEAMGSNFLRNAQWLENDIDKVLVFEQLTVVACENSVVTVVRRCRCSRFQTPRIVLFVFGLEFLFRHKFIF